MKKGIPENGEMPQGRAASPSVFSEHHGLTRADSTLIGFRELALLAGSPPVQHACPRNSAAVDMQTARRVNSTGRR
jgi:hypothetical protein